MNLSQPIHIPRLDPSSPRSPRASMHMQAARASAREYLSSTTRLGPTKEAWESLSTELHNFSRVCFLDEAMPDVLHEFTRLERCYEDFRRQAQTIFNNSRPSKSFVEKSYDDPQPLLGIGMVRKAQAVMNDLRFKAKQLCSMVKFYNAETFDPEMFSKYLEALDEGVKYLFANLIPRNSPRIGSVVGARRELIVACDELVKMFDGTNHYDEHMEKVWSAMEVMNEAFDNLFAMLNLKERTRMFVGGLGAEEEKPEPVKQDDDTILSVERIRDHMCDMEMVLSDTSKLFKKK